MPRFQRFLGSPIPQHLESYPILQLTNDEKRILGAAIISGTRISQKKTAEVTIKMSPRILKFPEKNNLIDAVLAKARSIGCKSVSSSPLERDSNLSVFQRAGFQHVKTEELWVLTLENVKSRLDRLAPRIKLQERWSVRAPTEAELPQLSQLCGAYEFLTEDGVRFDKATDKPGTYFNSQLSSVVVENERILSALLVQASTGTNCHVKIRATDPAEKRFSGVFNFATLYDSMSRTLAEGYQTTTLTVNRARDTETRNLAIRCKGRCLSARNLFHATL
ncbi:MAG: hypothetical protein AAGJ81_04875 [Verrucomicrobiota bacterium]